MNKRNISLVIGLVAIIVTVILSYTLPQDNKLDDAIDIVEKK